MAQFEIKRLIPIEIFGYDASFTNASLYMVIAVVLITSFLIFAMGRRALVPSRFQSMAELSYEYIANVVRENLGEEGMKYFPWVFTIFIFILTLNLLGMIPHSFTVTSHIIVTFAFAAMVWITVTLIGFVRHGFGYLRLFVPLLGLVFCGSARAYSYILESLKPYPAQRGVEARMRELGLAKVGMVNLLGGVMSINYAEKSLS